MTASEKKIKIQTIITVSCVIFAVLMIAALLINVIKLVTLKSRERELLEKIEQIDTYITQLDVEIEDRQSPEYRDWYIREYLNMVGKNNIVFTGE